MHEKTRHAEPQPGSLEQNASIEVVAELWAHRSQHLPGSNRLIVGPAADRTALPSQVGVGRPTIGVRVLAAPILDRDGSPLAAISVAAPAFTCSLEDFVAANAEPVVEAAQVIARQLSISGSTANLS